MRPSVGGTPAAAERGRAADRAGGRAGWIDLLKGLGIVTVVWIHAFQRLAEPMPDWVQRVGFLARFAVPGFLLAAGFLQAGGPRQDWSQFRSRRLPRLLAPYAIASLLALAVRVAFGDHRGSPGGVLRALLGGDGFGVYYFVPVLVTASACGEWLFRHPRLALPVWATFAILGQLVELRVVSLDRLLGSLWWEFRSPLRWWGYFFAGWVAAVHRDRIDALSETARRRAGVAILAAGAAAFATYLFLLPPGWTRRAGLLQYVTIYAAIGGTMILAWKSTPPDWIRWLSEASYPIYLYHYFPVFLLQRLPGGQGRDAATLVIALAVTCAGVIAVRRIFGPRARLLFG